jgi:hypothetical protein
VSLPFKASRFAGRFIFGFCSGGRGRRDSHLRCSGSRSHSSGPGLVAFRQAQGSERIPASLPFKASRFVGRLFVRIEGWRAALARCHDHV